MNISRSKFSLYLRVFFNAAMILGGRKWGGGGSIKEGNFETKDILLMMKVIS